MNSQLNLKGALNEPERRRPSQHENTLLFHPAPSLLCGVTTGAGGGVNAALRGKRFPKSSDVRFKQSPCEGGGKKKKNRSEEQRGRERYVKEERSTVESCHGPEATSCRCNKDGAPRLSRGADNDSCACRVQGKHQGRAQCSSAAL